MRSNIVNAMDVGDEKIEKNPKGNAITQNNFQCNRSYNSQNPRLSASVKEK